MGRSGECFWHDLTDAPFGLTDGVFGLMGKSPRASFKFKNKEKREKIHFWPQKIKDHLNYVKSSLLIKSF